MSICFSKTHSKSYLILLPTDILKVKVGVFAFDGPLRKNCWNDCNEIWYVDSFNFNTLEGWHRGAYAAGIGIIVDDINLRIGENQKIFAHS